MRCAAAVSLVLATLLISERTASPLEIAAASVGLTNTARYTDSGRYDWTVSVMADDATLNSIRKVEYTLHPSFPNPVCTVTDRKSRFALSSNGWGEFNIAARVFFEDGRVQNLEHWLTLKAASQPSPEIAKSPSPPHTHGAVSAGNMSHSAGDDRWDWTVFLIADDKTLDDIHHVDYTLHPTFPDPVRRVSTRGTSPGKGFFLSSNGWGTFTIGIRVTFKDGEVAALTHTLTFATK